MDIKKFSISLAVCFAVAALGSLVTLPSVSTWYATLNKPFFTPPNNIFGPVWTVLFALMGISLYLVWEKKTSQKKKRPAIRLFLFQLVVNFLWSFFFFGLHSIPTAMVIILVLLVSIYFVLQKFTEISLSATYLLIPYFLWVCFASILNGALLLLNG